jgi:serine protease Do
VLAVRTGGPAERQGIQRGDVLLGMHEWETVTPENVDYILNRPDFSQFEPLKFYILRAGNRGSEVLYGHMTVAGHRPIRQ